MRLLLIADLHIGSIRDTTYIYNIVTDIIDRELTFKKTDAVIFLGDYFHRLFKANEEYVSLAINIMSYLVRICKKNKVKIRFIYGTESHEMSQYRLFNYHLSAQGIDVKLIDTAIDEELVPGVKVLYLPEEYVDDREKHYGRFLNGERRYDYILGHGVIQEGWPMVIHDSASHNNEKQVPRFKSEELYGVGRMVVFGHYHVHNQYYLGSLFRDSFGEEEPKGYGVIEDGELQFIENTEAYVYRSYDYPETSGIYNGVDHLNAEIKRIKSENVDIFNGTKFGKLRMIFHLPVGIDPSFRENLQTLLFSEKGIATLIKESSSVDAEIVSTVELEYDFILDKSLPITDKIHRYINKNYPDLDLTLDELTGFINDDLRL